MEEVISKEEFDELMKLEGEIRGSAIEEVAEFILKEKGKKGLKKLEDMMVKLAHQAEYRRMKRTDFYPLGLGAFILLAVKRLFNFDDKKFQEMGKFQAKSSILVRLFAKYFVSLEKVTKEVPKMWRKYFTVGDLKVTEFNEEKRYVILRLENFRYIPMACQIFIGYFSSILQMVVRDMVTCKETKCVYRGDEHHEFLLKW